MTTLAYWEGLPPDNPVIRFYAIAILIGALTALFLASYRAHKDGYEWSFFGLIFIIAFPCGIIGARIWYVIAQWSTEFASRPFYHVFEIWNGGLAIQGGAIGGVLAGVLVAFFQRKGVPILKVTDFAVPTILVAQAIGRWGNFFNQEVFGHAVSPDAWSFLPGFITNNMTNGSSPMSGGVVLPSGSIASPLFLIEGVINIAFYILITHGLEALEGKRYKNGDSTFAYFIAYGIIRLILEPMRNSAFIMGSTENQKSASMALAFIIIGSVLMVLNHLLRYLDKIHVFDKVPYLSKAIVYMKNRAGDVQEINVSTKNKEDFSDIDLSSLKEKKEDEKEE